MSRRKIYYENIVVIGEEEWFWSGNFNALYKRDRNSGEIERVGEFENCTNVAYSKIVAYKGKIIGIPLAAKQIMIYDSYISQFRYIDIGIKNIEKDKGNLNKFYGAVADDNLLYIIGCHIAYILILNMETECVENYIDLRPFINKSNNNIGYMREGILYGRNILIPAVYSNTIFELNLNSLKIVERKFRKTGEGFSAIYRFDTLIWLFPYDEGEILEWNMETDKINIFGIAHLFQFTPKQRNFLSVMEINNKVWIFPKMGNMILTYDIATGKFSNSNVLNAYFEKIGKAPHFAAVSLYREEILLLPIELDDVIAFDIKKEKIYLKRIEIPEKELLRFLNMKEEIISETEIQLTSYLEFIQGSISKEITERKNSGINIFRHLWEG